MGWHVDDLPNPHLRTTLEPTFTLDNNVRNVLMENRYGYSFQYDGLGEAERRLIAPLHIAHIRCCHLPDDYDSLNDEAKLSARFHTFKSWYNADRTDQLCCSVENIIAALYLYVEDYLKADSYTGGIYSKRDSKTKYLMVRNAFSPPKHPEEPSKCVMHLPRFTHKTCTMIRQLCAMMALTRPFTTILISEINEDRSKEELQHIKSDIEYNEIIHRDFGGDGECFPRSSRKMHKWNDSQLDFMHLPQTTIQAYSFKSAQRGRHPLFGIIDDAEDHKTLRDRQFRRNFFDTLFHTYAGMFAKGGHIVLQGTTLRGSCLEIALSNKPDDPAEIMSATYDPRFDDWHKVRMSMIVENADGTRESILPDQLTVQGYDTKITAVGAAVVAAELDGRPIATGQYALIRDARMHGYMHCVREIGGVPNEYMLDLCTGQQIPWREFVEGLYVAAGTDVADSTAMDADLGACWIIGTSKDYVVYVLDGLMKRMIADDWVETGVHMASDWGCPRCGFESGTFQRVVVRMAQRLTKELEDKGKSVPKIIPVVNAGTGANKHVRVLAALRPLYRKRLIRFPYFGEISTPDGVRHKSIDDPMRSSVVELLRQLDTYTDEGPTGHDDGPDALQNAIRVSGMMRGTIAEKTDMNDAKIKQWEELGFTFSDNVVPPEARTAEMRERLEAVVVGDEQNEEIDPYG